ncbi:ABC transporter permease [Actinomadura craniellae]|uniref:ABC transporter permease n=1 Tax=Actinomadura craniellae TaxID=2231787 RepID=A0A365GWP0_9ACTN|nr:ABC transporter permease [Actinomadura craniellae]RAY11240.1 ABC transporter permease [Actinomadura craniellae]
MNTTVGPTLGLVLLGLAAVAALLVRLGSLELGRQVLVAAGRATVQLAAVSLLIAVVVRSAGWTALFIAGMAVVATVTAAGRVAEPRAWWVGASIVGGVAPVLLLVLATGLVPLRPIAVLPIAGILIGGAMTATALAGRRALEELADRHGEYEAALALGLLPRDAALEVCRPAAALALIPALDQTRTVGLVTLPGAFVGVLLGGADPVQAGATQLLILIALLAVEAVAVLATIELAARGALGTRRRA